MLVRRIAAIVAIALSLSLACSFPATAQTLTMGTKLELNTLDPHFFAAFPTGSSHELIYERLAMLDDKLVPRPLLAASWKNIDNLTWEIKLRKGVVFHNGAPFTADDVIFTWERVPNVPNSPNSFSQFTRGVEKIIKIDDHTLQMKTSAPTPMLPNDLANVFIVSASAAKGLTTQDFNSGKAAIGTGPYKLVEWKNGEQLTVERFDKYWGPKPPWAKVIEKVLAKDPARLAALLSGQVDAIDAVPSADMARIKSDGKYSLFRGPAALVHYIALDSARDVSPFVTAKDGKPLDKNPLKDPRVRKALSMAINRTAIIDRVMDGSGIAAAQLLGEQFPGSPKGLKPDAFDIAKAQALLKEAGWGDGFRIVLHATNDRYPNDASVAQVVAQMWTRLGLKAEVEAIPGSLFFSRASKQDFSAFAAQYGAEEAANSLRALVATYTPAKGFGTANRTRYSNVIVDGLLGDALQTMDDERRNELLGRAIKFAMTDQPLIPVFYPIFDFAAKKGLTITPRAQRRFNALMVRPTGK
ncbi:MAG: ABC transporter substrate-binding protein [Betaproteobacteria bacterium]|nr:ABC transporter substrate-binding protein [Betaproteobacteria bacterium]